MAYNFHEQELSSGETLNLSTQRIVSFSGYCLKMTRMAHEFIDENFVSHDFLEYTHVVVRVAYDNACEFMDSTEWELTPYEAEVLITLFTAEAVGYFCDLRQKAGK